MLIGIGCIDGFVGFVNLVNFVCDEIYCKYGWNDFY